MLTNQTTEIETRLQAERGVMGSCIRNPNLAAKVDLNLISDKNIRRSLKAIQDGDLNTKDGIPFAVAAKFQDGSLLNLLNDIESEVETSAGFELFLKTLQDDPVNTPVEPVYDASGGAFFIPDEKGDWIPVSEASIKRLLRKQGYPTEAEKNRAAVKNPDAESWTTVEDVLCETQMCRNVRYAGPLAGHSPGLKEQGGSKILVTQAPTIIEPKEGRAPLIQAVIHGLLGHDPRQVEVFLAWLKIAIESIRAAMLMPGQSVVLAGPAGCGKSLLQALITELLGGRAAKAFRYMSGATAFNGDLFGAEHLMIEDDVSTCDLRKRRALGAEIKSITVNRDQSCHGKYKAAVTLRPFWRLTISVNNEPENLQILPPLDESLKDKMILLNCETFEMPMPTGSPDERENFWNALRAEIPAFIDTIVKWTPSEDILDSRFGVKAYHHPDILEALDALAPETRLEQLIDSTIIWQKGNHSFNGSATELEKVLKDGPYRDEVKSLLTFSSACGVYLSRLALRNPARYVQNRGSGGREWQIHPPNP